MLRGMSQLFYYLHGVVVKTKLATKFSYYGVLDVVISVTSDTYND